MQSSPTHRPAIRAINLHDVRAAARQKLPRVLFDFIDGGSEGEVTLAANDRQFDGLSLLPRQASAGAPDMTTDLAGCRASMPVVVAPCGSARLVHPAGEVALACAAAAAGVPYIVPHMGGTALETVRSASNGVLWYQLYMVGGRAVAQPAIERATAAGYDVLVLTIDNGAPQRERDVRNGMAALTSGDWSRLLPHLPQLLARPGWLLRHLRGEPAGFPNAVVDGRPMTIAQVIAANRQPGSTFAWSDLDWIRRIWPGQIFVKSILTPGDARQAIDHGATGIIVSNHGGRGLDGAPATMRVLPDIVRAADGAAEVLVDGGFRRGGDIVKALACGARAVLAGRPTLFGLAYGEPGVAQVLEMLRADLRRTLVALGCPRAADVDASYLLAA